MLLISFISSCVMLCVLSTSVPSYVYLHQGLTEVFLELAE